MKPAVGKIVCVKISENEVRPAIITKAWSEDCINVIMFPDGTNDGADVKFEKVFYIESPNGIINSGGYLSGIWLTSIMKGNNIGNWNWPGEI